MPGNQYKFAVRAHNSHGFGPESEYLIVEAASAPERPDPPTTAIHNHYVKISWTVPYENSAPVDGYFIYLGDTTGSTFTQETLYCNGLEEPVLSQTYCEIPMTVLRSQFNLGFDAEVFAKVQAKNKFGESQISGVSVNNVRI